MIYQHPLAYLLGVEGAALLRAFAGEHDRDFTLARIAEVRAFVEAADDWGDGVTLSSVTTPEGYLTWAETYDQPGNQLVDLEQPVVREILHDLPVGLALDVACGTGRHAGYLAELGHRVIGVDSAQAMLDRAAANVPDASLSRADLHQLPVPDHAVDVVVCALALTHVPDLGAALTEFVRVLRPGGHLVISDSRGLFGYFGAPVPVRTSDGGPGVLPHRNRLASDYLAAALPLGLHVRRCVEPAGQPRSSTPTPGPRSRTWRRTTHRASGSSTRSARPPRTPPTATTRRPSSGTSKSSGDRRRNRLSPCSGGHAATAVSRRGAVPGGFYTHDVPAFAVAAAAVLILTAVAFLGRVATVAALSARRPHAAAFVNRYWIWFPVLTIAILLAVLLWPVGPVLAAVAIGVVLAKPDLFGLPPR